MVKFRDKRGQTRILQELGIKRFIMRPAHKLTAALVVSSPSIATLISLRHRPASCSQMWRLNVLAVRTRFGLLSAFPGNCPATANQRAEQSSGYARDLGGDGTELHFVANDRGGHKAHKRQTRNLSNSCRLHYSQYSEAQCRVYPAVGESYYANVSGTLLSPRQLSSSHR
jgi:hypothetical protein